MCGHNIWNTLGAVVILVLAIWPQLLSVSNLVIIVVAALMLLHGLVCRKCEAVLFRLSGKKKRRR